MNRDRGAVFGTFSPDNRASCSDLFRPVPSELRNRYQDQFQPPLIGVELVRHWSRRQKRQSFRNGSTANPGKTTNRCRTWSPSYHRKTTSSRRSGRDRRASRFARHLRAPGRAGRAPIPHEPPGIARTPRSPRNRGKAMEAPMPGVSAARPSGLTSRPAVAIEGDRRGGHRGAVADVGGDTQSPRNNAASVRYAIRHSNLQKRDGRAGRAVQPPCNRAARSGAVS